ncbi:hypothetical protein AB0N87_43320 [Streptomyces sp. NPDC093228]|uniref:hypothetical protein n=1 Tax=Streptomyces sp. NPDC093228 TaxID=3155070 RepID=UPI00342E2F98
MHESGPVASNDETLAISEHIVTALNDYNLSHLLLMGATQDFTGSHLEGLEGDRMFRHFREL